MQNFILMTVAIWAQFGSMVAQAGVGQIVGS